MPAFCHKNSTNREEQRCASVTRSQRPEGRPSPSRPQRREGAPSPPTLIRFVFFDRLRPSNFLADRFASTPLVVVCHLLCRLFVNVFKDVSDHRGRGRAAMDFATDIALVNCSESKSRLVGR